MTANLQRIHNLVAQLHKSISPEDIKERLTSKDAPIPPRLRYSKALTEEGIAKNWEILKAHTPLPLFIIIVIGLILSTIGALVEAVSWHGMDNLFIPLGIYLLLKRFMDLELEYLTTVFLVLGGLILLVHHTASRTQLNTHALLATILAGFFFFIVGGIEWFIAPLIVFLLHLALVKIQKDEGNYTISAVLSSTSGGFCWLFMEYAFGFSHAFYLFTFALAIHLQIIILLRLKAHTKHPATSATVCLASLLCSAIIFSTYLFLHNINSETMLLLIYATTVMAIGGIVFGIHSDRFSKRRWRIQAVMAIGGSSLGIIPIGIMGL